MWRASSRIGATGKRFQFSDDGPVRLRKIIGGAEMHGERQRRVAGGGGVQFELLADQVQPPAEIRAAIPGRCPASGPSDARR